MKKRYLAGVSNGFVMTVCFMEIIKVTFDSHSLIGVLAILGFSLAVLSSILYLIDDKE